jgi:hypothetical protein
MISSSSVLREVPVIASRVCRSWGKVWAFKEMPPSGFRVGVYSGGGCGSAKRTGEECIAIGPAIGQLESNKSPTSRSEWSVPFGPIVYVHMIAYGATLNWMGLPSRVNNGRSQESVAIRTDPFIVPDADLNRSPPRSMVASVITFSTDEVITNVEPGRWIIVDTT